MTVRKAIGLILVLALLGAGVWYLRGVERADQRNMRELYTAVEPLQKERDALAQERGQIEGEYALKMRDAGTAELLFREMDKSIFTDVYPLMRDRGIMGVLGLSFQEYPNNPGKLTTEQYSRLLMDGWGSCFIYDSQLPDLASWFDSILKKLERDGLAAPTAMLFPEGTYHSEMDETLIENGIRTLVLTAEDGHTGTVRPVKGELWTTGAMPWNYTGVNRDTELLSRTNGANLVFTISFKNLWDAYEKDAFVKVLDNWETMLVEEETVPEGAANAGQSGEDTLEKPQLRVVSLETARELHREAESRNVQLERELTKRQTELDAQIEELDAQIRELYDKWGESGKK